MKRSEMVEEIAKVIARFRGDLPPSRNEHFVASAIIEKMKELGMQEPVMEGVYDPVPTVTPTGNHEYSWKRGWHDEK